MSEGKKHRSNELHQEIVLIWFKIVLAQGFDFV